MNNGFACWPLIWYPIYIVIFIGLFVWDISPSISLNGIMGNDVPVSSNVADSLASGGLSLFCPKKWNVPLPCLLSDGYGILMGIRFPYLVVAYMQRCVQYISNYTILYPNSSPSFNIYFLTCSTWCRLHHQLCPLTFISSPISLNGISIYLLDVHPQTIWYSKSMFSFNPSPLTH